MTDDIEQQLIALEWSIWRSLDAIHDEFQRNMDWLARSVGQRTRTEKPKK